MIIIDELSEVPADVSKACKIVHEMKAGKNLPDNPNPWESYQPNRQRDKEIYDIELRDGTIVLGCYPNGVHWNAIWTETFGLPPKKAGRGPYPDYRVLRIRRSSSRPF